MILLHDSLQSVTSDKLHDNVRGFGYWSWKPEIIKQTLSDKWNDGDQLLYLDAGCNLNRSWQKIALSQYFDMLSQDVLH